MKHTKVTRKFLLLLASIGLPLAVSAQSDGFTIQVFEGQNSKPSAEYSIGETRKILFGADDFTFNFYEAPQRSFMFDNVRCVKFAEGLPTGIGGVSAADDAVGIRYTGSSLRVNGVGGKARLTVYDITGQPVISTTVHDGDEVSTESLAAGIYIVKVKDTTLKFSKI